MQRLWLSVCVCVCVTDRWNAVLNPVVHELHSSDEIEHPRSERLQRRVRLRITDTTPGLQLPRRLALADTHTQDILYIGPQVVHMQHQLGASDCLDQLDTLSTRGDHANVHRTYTPQPACL